MKWAVKLGKQFELQSLVESFLDSDGDGSVIDDLAGMVLNNGSQNKSGLGGMLGGLFGK